MQYFMTSVGLFLALSFHYHPTRQNYHLSSAYSWQLSNRPVKKNNPVERKETDGLNGHKKRAQDPFFILDRGKGYSLTAFILRRTRPCLSISRTLTLTNSPSFSLSLTFST